MNLRKLLGVLVDVNFLIGSAQGFTCLQQSFEEGVYGQRTASDCAYCYVVRAADGAIRRGCSADLGQESERPWAEACEVYTSSGRHSPQSFPLKGGHSVTCCRYNFCNQKFRESGAARPREHQLTNRLPPPAPGRPPSATPRSLADRRPPPPDSPLGLKISLGGEAIEEADGHDQSPPGDQRRRVAESGHSPGHKAPDDQPAEDHLIAEDDEPSGHEAPESRAPGDRRREVAEEARETVELTARVGLDPASEAAQSSPHLIIGQPLELDDQQGGQGHQEQGHQDKGHQDQGHQDQGHQGLEEQQGQQGELKETAWGQHNGGEIGDDGLKEQEREEGVPHGERDEEGKILLHEAGHGAQASAGHEGGHGSETDPLGLEIRQDDGQDEEAVAPPTPTPSPQTGDSPAEAERNNRRYRPLDSSATAFIAPISLLLVALATLSQTL